MNKIDEATQLFTENEKLASYFASKWFGYSPAEIHEDLIGEARIGLWSACLSYDPDRGVKFSTYAAKVITNQIRHYLRSIKNDIKTISLETELGGNDDLTLGDTASLGYEQEFISNDTLFSTMSGYKVLPMIAAGMTQRAIAARLGTSQCQVSRLAKREKKSFIEKMMA